MFLVAQIFFVFFINWCQCRDLWSKDLPEINYNTLEKGKPIRPEENYNSLQIRGLNGTLYSHSLSLLYNVTELKIFDNQIRTIENGALCSTPTLKILEIDLDKNIDPPSLTRSSFQNCNNLEEVLLKFDYNNFYSKLHQDALEPILNLKKLAIQSLNLTHLPKNFLTVNNNTLTHLILAFCNIHTIDADVFEDLRNLEEIQILHNIELTQLPKNLFTANSKLKRLVLRDNAIKDLTWDEFKGLSSLEELSLVDNQIAYFDAKKIAQNMPSLKKLDISINPVACDHKNLFVKEIKEKFGGSIAVEDASFGFYQSC